MSIESCTVQVFVAHGLSRLRLTIARVADGQEDGVKDELILQVRARDH